MAPVCRISSCASFPLTEGWRTVAWPAGQATAPDAVGWDSAVPAQVPGTAASALAAAGQWSLDTPRDFDAEDWWYQCSFDRPAAPGPAGRWNLTFEGLATLAEVWLNGARIATSANMFLRHEVDVTTE